MIAPLSTRRRNAYLFLGTIAFVVLIPVLILYSQGYRLNDAFSLEKTGGIYVRSDVADTAIYVDGTLTEETGLLLRNSFIQDIIPGTYDVRVQKNGYRPWSKKVVVEENLVTEIHHVPIAEEISSTTISRFIFNQNQTATSTRVRDPRYDGLLELFSTSTATVTPTAAATGVTVQRATTTVVVDPRTKMKGFIDQQGVYSWIDKGDVVFAWTGSYDRTPFYFCQGVVCVGTSTLSLAEPILEYNYVPTISDAALVLTASGLYVADIDNRSEPNVYPIVAGSGLAFRIDGSNIVVRKGDTFIVIEL